jgi:tetratricopeptide (TPR) repeat protein
MKSTLAIAALAILLASTMNAQTGSTPSSDTLTTASGLRYVITHHGSGPMATSGSYPIVHYTGRLTDGTIFDDSRKRNEPFAFRLGAGQVIKGWDEGVALLHVGDKATLVIPPAIGYGEKGAGKVIPPNATLVFDLELLDIKEQTLGGYLADVAADKGAAAVGREYTQWKKSSRDQYYVSESDINAAGYRFLKMNKVDEAIAIFKVNVDLFPKSGNVYDSIGEAYMDAGNKKQAISCYTRSLALDPSNTNAEEMLKKLKVKN